MTKKANEDEGPKQSQAREELLETGEDSVVIIANHLFVARPIATTTTPVPARCLVSIRHTAKLFC